MAKISEPGSLCHTEYILKNLDKASIPEIRFKVSRHMVDIAPKTSHFSNFRSWHMQRS